MENQDLDLIVFEDDNGNQITMEVLEYFFYEGKEYATLVEYKEDSKCSGCDGTACESCSEEEGPVDVTVMQVVPVGDDEEEFVPVDEALGNKLIELLNNGAFDDDSEDEEEE